MQVYYRVLHSGGPDGEIGASLRYLSQRFTMPNRTTSALLNDIGTEELSHLEMVSTIVHQLTRDLSMEEIEKSGFGPYYIDHTVGVWPQAAGGVPFNACEFQSKGDPITDLFEDLAAEQKARSTYDNILRVVRNIPEIADPIKFLRAREVVHFQRFGEALQSIQEELDAKNFYAFTPDVLQTLVIALGAGLGIWGVINLLEGYGNDNPGAKSQGIKQLMAGGGVALIGTILVPLLSGLFG